MRAILGASLALVASAVGDHAQASMPTQPATAATPASPALPDASLQQAQLANHIGGIYRSMYAPGVPAMTMPMAGAQQGAGVTAGMGGMSGMGGMYGGSYGPMGTNVGQAYGGAFGGSASEVQASQSQLANQLGQFYRAQFLPPGVESQVAAQQAAQEAAMAAQQAEQAEQAAQQALQAKQSKDQAATKGAPQMLAAAPAPAAPGSQAPAVPTDATDCQTMEQLDAWYAAREGQLKKYVPKEYQKFALKSVDSEYESNKERIQGGGKAGGSTGGGSSAEPSVTGPLMLASGPDAQANIADTENRFKQKAEQIQSGVDDIVDQVSDSLKNGFGSAIQRAEKKADSTAAEAEAAAVAVSASVQERMQEVARLQDQEAGKSAPAASFAEAPAKGFSASALLLPFFLVAGAAGGFYLRKRTSRDDLESVYHMQV